MFSYIASDVDSAHYYNIIYRIFSSFATLHRLAMFRKSIYNEFNKWTKDNVFEEAFYKFVNSKYFKISKVKKDKNINLFIDVTKIANHL